MPLYEYRCNACGKKFTFLVTKAIADSGDPKCPDCGSADLSKLISRVRRIPGAGSYFEGMGRPDDRRKEEPEKIY